MKFLIVLLAVFAFVAADHDHHNYKVKTREDLLKYRDECVAKLNVPAELVEKYKKWEYPDDDKTHCYIKCVFEKFELFDENNGFNVHNIHHQLVGADADHTDEVHAKIEKCADKNTEGSNACAWAYRGVTCFIKEDLRLIQKSVIAKET